jgi:hypothetical protein
MEWIRGLLFVWLVAVVLIATFALPQGKFAGGFHQPAIALELAASPADAQKVIEEAGRDVLKSGIRSDYFFIALYSIFFLALAASLILLRWQTGDFPGWAMAAGGCAIATALFDLRENRFILQILEQPAATPEALASLHAATLWKWGLLFAALALFARPLVAQPLVGNLAGHVFLTAAAVGGLGLFRNRLIEAAFFVAAAGFLLAVGFLVLAWRARGGAG